MKTLLLSFFMLIGINMFGQAAQPTYLRAKTVSIGFRETVGSEITWTKNGEECSILVECYTTKVIINSQRLQTYHILYPLTTEVPNQAAWRCKDLEANTCNVKMTSDPKYPGFVAVEVEYDDAIWFYICTRD